MKFFISLLVAVVLLSDGRAAGDANLSPAKIKNKLGIEMIERTYNGVRIWMGATEVTQQQWELLMKTNPSYNKKPNHPVEMITAGEAEQFCRELSVLDGRQYRLPTEAEWESVCKISYPSPEALKNSEAWTLENSSSTRAVASLPADRLGFYDLLGNVAEWCTVADGDKSVVVLKGGSFVNLKSTTRWKWRMDLPQKDAWKAGIAGFRVVCVADN